VIGYALVIAVLAVAVAVDAFRSRTTWGPLLARIGAAILAVGVMWGNLTGDDLAWFAALGVPGNLLLFAGCLVIARRLWPDGGEHVSSPSYSPSRSLLHSSGPRSAVASSHPLRG
jgi:hypothetical protein